MKKLIFVLLAVILSVFIVGCGNQTVQLTNTFYENGYTIKYPANWKESKNAKGIPRIENSDSTARVIINIQDIGMELDINDAEGSKSLINAFLDGMQKDNIVLTNISIEQSDSSTYIVTAYMDNLVDGEPWSGNIKMIFYKTMTYSAWGACSTSASDETKDTASRIVDSGALDTYKANSSISSSTSSSSSSAYSSSTSTKPATNSTYTSSAFLEGIKYGNYEIPWGKLDITVNGDMVTIKENMIDPAFDDISDIARMSAIHATAAAQKYASYGFNRISFMGYDPTGSQKVAQITFDPANAVNYASLINGGTINDIANAAQTFQIKNKNGVDVTSKVL